MTTTTEYSVRIAGSDLSFRCAPDMSLLEGAQPLGLRGVPSGCRSGGCGVCLVRIDSGPVRTAAMSRAHVDGTRAAQGMVLACRTYPLGDLRISLPGRQRLHHA